MQLRRLFASLAGVCWLGLSGPALAQVAVARDYGRMEWAVLDWNETAIRFYRGIGARPMNEWTVYRLTGDALKRAADL